MPEPVIYERALPPAHFSLKIESFSALSRLGKDKYDSEVFKAGGYKWRLSLYPNGNEKGNGSGYISLYLSIEERDKLAKLADGEKVHVNYKLFVYNKSRKKYLTIEGPVSSFDRTKTQRGFPRFLYLKNFKKDGYLEGDSCTFGAEVFVTKPAQLREESFTLTKYRTERTFTWKIQRWSTLGNRRHSDEEFTIEGRQWKILVYPKGNADSKKKSMSVYLEVQRLTGKTKVYAEFSLRVLDQLKKKYKYRKFKCWLSASHPSGGDADFMPLEDLEEKSGKGFVFKNTLIVDVQFRVISAKPN